MKLIYRGIKYSSDNSTALKIVKKHKSRIGRLIDSKKFYKATVSYKFPVYDYFKQLLSSDPNFVRNPKTFRDKYLSLYLIKCWKSSEITILDACWKMTLEKEQEDVTNNSPQKFKYRGVTYYK